jgi:hypothetical protein
MLAVGGALAILLANTPANRDGMPCELATAKHETQSAARSAALAVRQWTAGRSTDQLVAVQLSDTRQAVVRSYQQITALKANHPDDARRQQVLATTMTDIVNDLSQGAAAVHGLSGGTTLDELPARLLGRVTQLDQQYG